MHTNFWSENLKGRETFGDLSIDWRIILGKILGKRGVRCGQDSSGSVKDPVAGSYERCNKPCQKRLCSKELEKANLKICIAQSCLQSYGIEKD
jgi:hypothetical protein